MGLQPTPLAPTLEKRLLRQRRLVAKRAQLACTADQHQTDWGKACVEPASPEHYRCSRLALELTSEEVTAKRRAERKQFKLDRARAIAAVAAEAEAAFAVEGRVIQPALSGPAIPSAATWRPAPAPEEPSVSPSPAKEDAAETTPEEPLEDVEHLQLTLQEAFFLLWNLDCLTVFDPHTVRPASFLYPNCPFLRSRQYEPMTLQQIWLAFQLAHLPPRLPLPSSTSPTQPLQSDNPFLINYAVYHHYRSLGWVVKGGIKFCVDYLLYKRGPVFSHAECVFFLSFTSTSVIQ